MNRKTTGLLFFLLIFQCSVHAQQKIPLNSAMLYNFSTKGDAGLWVDEQSLAGDPASGGGGQPVTVFSPGWVNADIYYPAMVVLDLGRDYNLSSLWFFDVNDSDSLYVYTGTPAQWQPAAAVLLNNYNSWRVLTLNKISRFLMFRLRSPSTRVSEIVLYGSAIGSTDDPPTPVSPARPLMQHFLGVNGFIDDPLNRLSCVGNLREYHNWGWDEGNTDTSYPGYPNNQYAWNPSWVSGPGWGFYFDTFYGDLQSLGIGISPDLQGAAPYITGFNDSLTQHKPISFGENALSPAAYTEHADYMFQFAARYGQSTVETGMLKLKADQQALTGLSLVKYLENWNEPDKWWFSRGGYFSPDEYAAMCSADYDGHNNSLGAGKGMKNADPQIKMVMGGLASLNLEYVRCMKLWSDYNRNGVFPADVLNFHHYSENGTHGISPEEDGLMQKLQTIVAYRNTFLPEKEIWLSEFGYDTNPESTQAAVAIDTNDIYEVQGQWIMRSFLAAAAAGVDKAFVYMLRDANAPNPNKYNSSGLTNEIWNGHQPKKSWYYVNTMSHHLQNTRFAGVKDSQHTQVNVYAFQSATSDTIVYAVWCPSSNNTVVENFSLDIDWATQIQLITPTFGIENGVVGNLIPRGGKVNFRVTERPVFVRTTGNRKIKITGDLRFFNQEASPLPENANDFWIELLDSESQTLAGPVQPQFEQNSWVFSFDPVNPDSLAFIRLWEQPPSNLLADTWLWNNWTGITAVDALIISYLAIQHPAIGALPHLANVENPTPYMKLVADINNSSTISALDALMLMYRYLGRPGMNPFPGGRHHFIIGGHVAESAESNIWPSSPAMLFSSDGVYEPNAASNELHYTCPLELDSGGEVFYQIYFTPAGDLNLSAQL